MVFFIVGAQRGACARGPAEGCAGCEDAVCARQTRPATRAQEERFSGKKIIGQLATYRHKNKVT
jgi:hypothetical protein